MAAPTDNVIFRSRGRRTQRDWEGIAQRQLDDAQLCAAYDIARLGLQFYPQSLKLKQITARALTRTGALDPARELLEDLCNPHLPDEATLRRLTEVLRKTMTLVATEAAGEPSGHAMEALSELSRELGNAVRVSETPAASDEETLSLLGRVYKDIWKETGDRTFAIKARDTYLRAFRESGSHYPAVNAATISWLLGETKEAQRLAHGALAAADAAGRGAGAVDPYWSLVTQGEALLVLGRGDDAFDCYGKAGGVPGVRHGNVVSAKQQLLLIRDNAPRAALPALSRILRLLEPPTVVVFVGHRIDEPGRASPRFPPALEKIVRRRIDACLQEIDARIGYCAAANGSDILFIEAMRDRDAEVNVVLPFNQDDFVRTSVEHPSGGRWVARFRHALRAAAFVKHATTEEYLDTPALFAFGSDVTRGLAELRAASLETEPYLVAVYDGKDTGGVGGTHHLVRRWRGKNRLRVIPLAAPSRRENRRPLPSPRPTAAPAMEYLTTREIKTLLFADVKGYSDLPDTEIPRFIDSFLKALAGRLRSSRAGRTDGRFVNTWGDAIFAVMDDPVTMMEYAVALQSVVETTDWVQKGFPVQLSLRIALHAGPVFSGQDPLTRRKNYYGAHVNRAARLEPVTLPGRIYATEQFVAYLVSRLLSEGKVERIPGRATPLPYHCEYVGEIELAKGFGHQPTYHLRRRLPGARA